MPCTPRKKEKLTKSIFHNRDKTVNLLIIPPPSDVILPYTQVLSSKLLALYYRKCFVKQPRKQGTIHVFALKQ